MVRFSLCSSCDWIEAERRGGLWEFGEGERGDNLSEGRADDGRNLADCAWQLWKKWFTVEESDFVKAELGSINSASRSPGTVEVRRDL